MGLTITKFQFEKIKPQALIIDVRDNWEHQQLKKLPNSINIPFLELVNKLEKYISDKKPISYYLLQLRKSLRTSRSNFKRKRLFTGFCFRGKSRIIFRENRLNE